MDLFVVLMTNLSMVISKLYCLFVQMVMMPNTISGYFEPKVLLNNTSFQQKAAEYYQDYVEQLNLMPFYNIDYTKQLETLNQYYQESNEKTWVDFWTYWYIRLEINSKMFLSYLMKSDIGEPDLTCASVIYSGQDFKKSFQLATQEFLGFIRALA